MKGVVLAGGWGTRLLPLTKVTNKHLLPVGKEPMIFHPIKKLIQAGVNDILIVTGTEHMGAVVGLLGSGHDFGALFTYRVQDRAGGIAEALGLARGFARDHQIAVLLGDNIFEDDLLPFIQNFERQPRGARILLKVVPDPERYGVAEVGQDGLIQTLEEKPTKPRTLRMRLHFAVTGIYFYDRWVFDRIALCKPSARGELEITDVNRLYLEAGELEYDVLQGYWTDAGTHESLARANAMVQDALRRLDDDT